MSEKPRSSPLEAPSNNDPRTATLISILTDPSHPRVRKGNANAGTGPKTVVTSRWRIATEPGATPMVRRAADDLARFLREALGVVCAPSSTRGPALRVRIDPVAGSDPDGVCRDHRLTVRDGEIDLAGATEWGAACGLYHVQRLMRLRGEASLPEGVLRARAVLDPSLTALTFKHGSVDTLDFPEAYDENYLLRIARAGYTGFHIDPGFPLFYRSALLPELDHPRADENLELLRQVVARARRASLQVFLTPYVQTLPADHPLFRRRPELRGSEIVASPGMHIPCTGRELVRRFYAEQAVRLFQAIPDLGGLFLITGCEGMLHCYTAPASRPASQTDCPCCRRKDPEQTVARLVNGMATAVKRAAPRARVVVWPYHASTWTAAPDATRHVSLLSPPCSFMGNFDTDEPIVREGVRAMTPDYNLSVVGPSGVFLRQARVAARRGLPVLAKVESGCPRDMHAIPSIPANTRWARKYGRMLENGVTGAMFAWQFCSFTGSLSEEIAGWMSWTPCPPSATLLRRLAARDFGVPHADAVVRAWRDFDRAMETFPYSGPASRFRRGVFAIGFAHPLVLDALRPGELDNAFWLDGAARQRPTFVTDLSWTHPYGAEVCLKSLVKTERAWSRGCERLDAIPSPGARDPYVAGRLDAHQALARGIRCILRTAIHTIRFLDTRDTYFREPSNLALARKRLTAMREIAKLEIANAEEGLRCMQRNIQLGIDYANRAGFSEAMVRCKLAHTRRLVDWTLPYQMFLHSTSECGRDEWIRDDGGKWR